MWTLKSEVKELSAQPIHEASEKLPAELTPAAMRCVVVVSLDGASIENVTSTSSVVACAFMSRYPSHSQP